MEILILRDPRESKRKCSLTPLRGKPGIRFVNWRPELLLPTSGHLLLHPEGEELAPADAGSDLLLIDCSWRRLATMLRALEGVPPRRRLPRLATAYPRKSRFFADPDDGLASVEALFAATAILGAPRHDLLDEYRWRDAFYAANPSLAARVGE